VALWVFWFLRLLDEALRMLVADLLFGFFRGPGLLAIWDGPLSRSSFPGLFLGGISLLFYQALKRWAPMLGFSCREAIELQWEREIDLEREKESGTESKANSYSKIPPPWGCQCRSIYRGGQGSHCNALNHLNHLPHQ
jgi:hypothetical protein